MRNIDLILIAVATIETIVLIASFLYWITLFYQYKSQSKHLKTLDDIDFPSQIAKVTTIATRADKTAESLSESLTALNAKLNARWRRDARAEKKESSSQEAYTGEPVPEYVPEEPTIKQSRMKRAMALYKRG